MAQVGVAQTRPHDWLYLSEGGSTIVFSYGGPPHPAFTGRVLRLRKAAFRHTTATERDADPLVAFQKSVIAALVPPEYLPDLVPVRLDAGWLAALELLRDHDRPPGRRANDRMDKAQQNGLLATDLVGGADILAVEIKPKWGFMPNAVHLSQETAAMKTSTCRFCMLARFRSMGGVPATQYCPLDLYSTDERRVKKAIRDLWDGWVQTDGTLNNMRVFVSGKMIRPSESLSSLAEFLSSTTGVDEALATALLPSLRSPILRTISSLQRSLDPLDIEGLAKLYALAYPDAKGLGAMSQNPSLGRLQEFATAYRAVYREWDHSKLCPEHIDTYLVAYLLSATFKDCSLMFRIRRSDTARRWSSPGAVYIIDLDLKGVDRFERWVDLDRRLVEYWRETEQRKPCFE